MSRLKDGYYLDENIELKFGQLLNSLDMNSRWIYKGSLTTPPCDTFIYWNVLTKVLPIKPKHLYFFRMIQAESDGKDYANGNYREVMSIDRHEPKLLGGPATAEEDRPIPVDIILVLLIFFFLSLASLAYLHYYSTLAKIQQYTQVKASGSIVNTARRGNDDAERSS